MTVLGYLAMTLLAMSDPADNSTASELARLWLQFKSLRRKR